MQNSFEKGVGQISVGVTGGGEGEGPLLPTVAPPPPPPPPPSLSDFDIASHCYAD